MRVQGRVKRITIICVNTFMGSVLRCGREMLIVAVRLFATLKMELNSLLIFPL